MDNLLLLLLIGFTIGTLGTLIGAGGGFILVPILLLTNPDFKPEVITAISIAVVAANALSGTIAYARAKRIDYKAGRAFALFTIPGSILGAFATSYISKHLFNIVFSIILIVLGVYLFLQKKQTFRSASTPKEGPGWRHHLLKDRDGEVYSYTYNHHLGILISAIVGFISPLLGIGGGIIHVPALVNWLRFPVHIATATSHFILAIMSIISVVVHIYDGNYDDPHVIKIVIGISIGAIGGAQLGAYISPKIEGSLIIKALAISLGLVGIRILIAAFGS